MICWLQRVPVKKIEMIVGKKRMKYHLYIIAVAVAAAVAAVDSVAAEFEIFDTIHLEYALH